MILHSKCHKTLQLQVVCPLDPTEGFTLDPTEALQHMSRPLDPTPKGSQTLHASNLTLGALNFSLAQGPGKGKSGTDYKVLSGVYLSTEGQ